MENIIYRFEDISERDIDMLLMQEIGSNIELLKYILHQSIEYKVGKISVEHPRVVEIIHSHVEPGYGESDIVVIYEDNGKKYGLFIEDKINAKAMDQQAARYTVRADIAKRRGDIEGSCIFMIAPKKYIEDNNPEAEVHKYPNKLCYEDIMMNVKLSPFHIQQMADALKKHRSNHMAACDDDMTRGWAEYKSYRDKYFMDLDMYYSKPGKSHGETWIKFYTWLKGVVIYHKTNPSKSLTGTVELNFPINPRYIGLLKECLMQYSGNFTLQGYELKQCGRSQISLLKKVPLLDLRKLDLEDEDSGQVNILEECLQVARNLNDDIVSKLLQDEALEKIKELVEKK